METLQVGELTVRGKTQAGHASMSWVGVSDGSYPRTALRPYLERFAGQCADAVVTLDFSAMSYANSGTVTEIVFLVRSLSKVASRVTITYNPAVRVQESIFTTMQTLAVDADRVFYSPSARR